MWSTIRNGNIKETHMGVCKLMRVSFDTLDTIRNWKKKHPSTHMDILRHIHNEFCDE